MSTNPAASYGRDIRCVLDADALFSEVEDVELVRQDAIHRLMTDNVLGDDGTGSRVIVGWGFDVRRLLGSPASELAGYEPVLEEVLRRDPRVESADVRLTTTTTNGVADVELRVSCVTALGPFDFVTKISELAASDLVGQP